VCQRSVRWGPWLYIVTYHGGLHLFEEEMLFNIDEDPHQIHNLIHARPDAAGECARRLAQWHQRMMPYNEDGVDPLQVVLNEGGPFHSKGFVTEYAKRLEATGRGEGAAAVRRRYPADKNS